MIHGARDVPPFIDDNDIHTAALAAEFPAPDWLERIKHGLIAMDTVTIVEDNLKRARIAIQSGGST